jgi:hypothetical protein
MQSSPTAQCLPYGQQLTYWPMRQGTGKPEDSGDVRVIDPYADPYRDAPWCVFMRFNARFSNTNHLF